jgi:hypothetical protein
LHFGSTGVSANECRTMATERIDSGTFLTRQIPFRSSGD